MTLVSRLIQKTGAKTLLTYTKRTEKGFKVVIKEPATEIYAEHIQTSLLGLNRTVEFAVKDEPEQYQWEYKRFRYQPEGKKSHIVIDQSRQNWGVSKTSKVKTSSRPKSRPRDKPHLLESGIPPYVTETSPRPGPRLFMLAPTAVNAVVISRPVANKTNSINIYAITYTEKSPKQIQLHDPALSCGQV